MDAVRDYLRTIAKQDLLTADEEVELAKAIEVGVLAEERLSQGTHSKADERDLRTLVSQGERAKSRFIQANLKLVVSIAKRYTGRSLVLLDLVQEGNLGLIHAVEKYDFKAGFKFSTYATWWIRQSITRALADAGRMIRIPVHTAEKINVINRTKREMFVELGREPSIEEVSEAVSLRPEQVRQLLDYDSQPVSLHTPVGVEDGSELGDLIEDDDTPDPSEIIDVTLRNEDVQMALKTLSAREAHIVRHRYGLDGNEPMTLDRVGAMLGISQERVRQLEKRALRKLRMCKLEHYATYKAVAAIAEADAPAAQERPAAIA
ncbi:sigma-70 family RNA polymerase sigma factor [Okibacterium endophyticum]